MIDLLLADAAADMRQTLAAANGERRYAARGLESGHHLALFRLPDCTSPTVFHYRLEVALHHMPPVPEFLAAAAEAFGSADEGATDQGGWTVRGGMTNEGLRLWTAWLCWHEDEARRVEAAPAAGQADAGQVNADSADANASAAEDDHAD